MKLPYDQAHVDRFTGYADTYDRYRPEAPQAVLDMICRYTAEGAPPSLVVDLGSGTGLSSFAWVGRADAIVGIEPSDDMRSEAQSKLAHWDVEPRVEFHSGYAHATGLPSECAGVVTCSQSFHWMDPLPTLTEAARILKSGGAFAVYDCDWPPAAGWEVESAYMHFMDAVEKVSQARAANLPTIAKRDKNQHLANIRQSGLFRFAREVVLHHEEPCDAERFVGLALSQGGYQTLRKAGIAMEDEVQRLEEAARRHFGTETQSILFSYRLRLGIK